MGEGTSPVAALEVERDCCAQLTTLLDAERAAIARHDLVALLGALHERETVQARWQHAAARRPADAALDAGAADPAVLRLAAELRCASGELARALRIHEKVVRGALQQVGDLLAALRRAQPGIRYDEQAALAAPLPSASRGGWSA